MLIAFLVFFLNIYQYDTCGSYMYSIFNFESAEIYLLYIKYIVQINVMYRKCIIIHLILWNPYVTYSKFRLLY